MILYQKMIIQKKYLKKYELDQYFKKFIIKLEIGKTYKNMPQARLVYVIFLDINITS